MTSLGLLITLSQWVKNNQTLRTSCQNDLDWFFALPWVLDAQSWQKTSYSKGTRFLAVSYILKTIIFYVCTFLIDFLYFLEFDAQREQNLLTPSAHGLPPIPQARRLQLRVCNFLWFSSESNFERLPKIGNLIFRKKLKKKFFFSLFLTN